MIVNSTPREFLNRTMNTKITFRKQLRIVVPCTRVKKKATVIIIIIIVIVRCIHVLYVRICKSYNTGHVVLYYIDTCGVKHFIINRIQSLKNWKKTQNGMFHTCVTWNRHDSISLGVQIFGMVYDVGSKNDCTIENVPRYWWITAH
jgi:hypothetical protein